MHDQIKTIDHSEIFSSEDAFLNFFKPVPAGDSPEGQLGVCKSFQLPVWHLFRRPIGLISGAELSNGIVKLLFSFPVSPQYDLQTSIGNKWIRTEIFELPFNETAKYFVNGTIFGTEDGGLMIINGPKEFTWTFREPEGKCVSCGEEICDDDAKSDH